MTDFTDKEKALMVELYDDDVKLRIIAKRVGHPISSVSSWLRVNHELTRNAKGTKWKTIRVKVKEETYTRLKKQAKQVKLPLHVRRLLEGSV